MKTQTVSSVSVTEFLAARRSAQPALIYGSAAYSYADLDRLSATAAGGLARLGVRRGDRVALWLPNTPAWLVLNLACGRLGAVAVSINTRYRAGEVSAILGRSRAKLLALWPGFKNIDFAGILADADPAALEGLETLILYREGDGGSDGTLPVRRRQVLYEDLLAAPPVADSGAPGDPWAIFTTSGTTKAPKFVVHRQEGILHHAADAARAHRLEDATLLQTLPFCGVFGYCQAMAALAAGRTMVVQRLFDAEEAAALIRRHAVTNFNASDEMVDRILAAARPGDLDSLRFVGYARFNASLADLPERAGAAGVSLRGVYGMSEVQALFALQPEDGPHTRLAGGKPVSPQAAARVRDPETGTLLPPGRAGELELRGPSLMAGYLDDPAATAAAIDAEGWLRTGDLAEATGDGGFVFLSRMGDVLRLGGFLVGPAEIESHIETHPAVAGCVVVGVNRGGVNRVVAFVMPEPGAGFSEQAIIDHCRTGLSAPKVPVRVVSVDSFPFTPGANGNKVQRDPLRRMAEDLP